MEGNVTATNALTYNTGTWSMGIKEANNRVLNFDSMRNFSELNRDWKVVQLDELIIKLQPAQASHIGNDKGTDCLTLERI